MSAVINTNVNSMNVQRALASNQSDLQKTMHRLSTGLRINGAADDAAGLAITSRMTSQARGMDVAYRNANDAISLAETADSTLGQVANYLQRMRDLAVQAANVTNTSGDRDQLQNEFKSLSDEVSRILTNTTFNGLYILGSNAGSQAYQVGANSGETVTVTTSNMVTGGVYDVVSASTISGTDGTNASTALTAIDKALSNLSTERSVYGAAQSRFEGIVSLLQISRDNQLAASGRITDADYASEMAKLTRAQILQQASTSMLSQANSQPNYILTLLRG